jgi:hypothetical protein
MYLARSFPLIKPTSLSILSFPEKQILHQRPVETIRHLPESMKTKAMDVDPGLWPVVRRHLGHLLA